jgi:hypothetical protein
MKRIILLATLLVVLLIPATSMARTDVFFNLGIGIPAPVVVAPPSVLVAPAPVVVYPPAVVVQPAPIIVDPPGWYVGRHKGWYKHHKYEFEEDD